MDEALKPCPFCGSDNIGWVWNSAYSTDSSYGTFGCLHCDANFPSSDDGPDANDFAAWNTRADLTPSLERLKRWEKFTRADDWITAEQFDREFQAFGLELRDLIAKMEAGE